MAKKRLYQVAREYNITSEAIVKMCKDLGYPVKNHMSTADDAMMAAIDAKFKKERESVRREIEIKREKAKIREQKAREKTEAVGEIALGKDSDKEIELETWDEMVPKKGVEKIGSKDTRPARGVKTTADRKKKRKKDRRRRQKRRAPDQREVADSVRKTLARMDGAKRTKKHKRRGGRPGAVGDEDDNTLQVVEFMSVAELASEIGIKPTELIAKCMSLGMMATINQRLDLDTIQTIALEYGLEVEEVKEIGIEEIEEDVEELDESNLVHRPPIITIMGHVDHGKTSLLDYLRHTNIVDGESGHITQHIGAYQVRTPGGRLTFLDTPGHAAFTAMRARGAQATDIVVLVVAANDAVQQQTVEAIDHARAAGVPIIVAINKMDLPDANAETVRQQLAQHNLLAEDWGGKTITVEISAKTGMNVDKLLEMILLQAEVMELKANPDARAKGVVIEAKVEKGRGVVCSVLVQSGTLRLGSPTVIGNYYAKIRTIIDDLGQPMTEVGPGTPAQITGLSGIPQAGDKFFVTPDEAQARNVAIQRQRIKREQDIRHFKRVALTDVYEQIREGQVS